MSDSTPEISPVLKQGANKRNLDAARKAVTTGRFHAWTLVGPYMGSDTHSEWDCELGCGWRGKKFYSHIRGRTDKAGNWTPCHKTRHPGCIPADQQEAALKEWRTRNNLI